MEPVTELDLSLLMKTMMVDEDDDGINDNRQMDGSGNQYKYGEGQGLGKRYGPGDGLGHGGNGPHDGTGYGPGNCQD